MKHSSTVTGLLGGEHGGEEGGRAGSYLAGDRRNEEERKTIFTSLWPQWLAPTEENGMGIDLGSRTERGRRPAKTLS